MNFTEVYLVFPVTIATACDAARHTSARRMVDKVVIAPSLWYALRSTCENIPRATARTIGSIASQAVAGTNVKA